MKQARLSRSESFVGPRHRRLRGRRPRTEPGVRCAPRGAGLHAGARGDPPRDEHEPGGGAARDRLAPPLTTCLTSRFPREASKGLPPSRAADAPSCSPSPARSWSYAVSSTCWRAVRTSGSEFAGSSRGRRAAHASQSFTCRSGAAFADIILPACTNFERWDFSEFANCGGHIHHSFTQCDHRVAVMQQNASSPWASRTPATRSSSTSPRGLVSGPCTRRA